MNKLILLFFFISASCQTKKEKNIYPRMIGDIIENTKLDDVNFKLCHDEKFAIQYYALNEKPYLDEKGNLLKLFQNKYDVSKVKKESGLIRIRFLVNCKGETGRFRIISSDYNYKEKTFDSNITNQLLNITKNLKGWQIFERNDNARDYYFYLIFKIDNGVIKEILP